jgi:hypothetical protein
MSKLQVQVVERDTIQPRRPYTASAGVISYLMYDVKIRIKCRNAGTPREKYASPTSSFRHQGLSLASSHALFLSISQLWLYTISTYGTVQYTSGFVGQKQLSLLTFAYLYNYDGTIVCVQKISKNRYSYYVLTTEFVCIYIFERFSCCWVTRKRQARKPKNFPANCALKADPSNRPSEIH